MENHNYHMYMYRNIFLVKYSKLYDFQAIMVRNTCNEVIILLISKSSRFL